MPTATITYFGKQAKVMCDGGCSKAWGIQKRPQVLLSKTNEDDFAWKADGELGKAPKNPGTSEGFECKPESVSEFPNKWCVRQCERCVMSRPGQVEKELKLKDFSKRFYNCAPPHKGLSR